MEEFFKQYGSEEAYQSIIKRLELYDIYDLMAKISCASFFLRTTVFQKSEKELNPFEYSKAILYLTSLYITRGFKSGSQYIKYTELKILVEDINRYIFSNRDYKNNDEVEAIALSQSMGSEVLGGFKSYYILTVFEYQKSILAEMQISKDEFVSDVFNYLKFYDLKSQLDNITFEEYINNYNDYDNSNFIYNGKFQSVMDSLTCGCGIYPNLYSMHNPFYSMDIAKCCFIKIKDRKCCFIPEIITGKLPKYFTNAIPKEQTSLWYENRKSWSENSVASLFYKNFPKADILDNNFYYLGKKRHRSENDIIVEFKGFLFIIEVKAANVTPDPVYENESTVIASYHQQIEEGINQCNRVEEILINEGSISLYNEDNLLKTTIYKVEYEEIFKITVTFEEMGSFLPGFMNRKNSSTGNIIINFYDLFTVMDYLSNPAYIIKYFQERKLIVPSKCIIHDELVYLGIFTTVCIHFSEYINSLADERKEFGYIVFPEVEFISEIENFYENVNQEKAPFNINSLVQKLVNVNYKNISTFEMSHLIGILNLPTDDHDMMEQKYNNPYNRAVFRFRKKDEDLEYAVVIKKTKKECMEIVADYFHSHSEVNKIVIIYFDASKTKITTIKRSNPELKKIKISNTQWNRTVLDIND